MCAAPNSTHSTTSTSPVPKQGSASSTSKPVPNWMKMKQQNKSSAGKNAKPTAQKSSGSSAQKPREESRNAKRARWAKKSKPVAKAVVNRGPVKEYISACCSASATKPRAGVKEAVKDPESGKTKDKSKGLGHWRCSQCRKVCKVTPQAPAKKVATVPSQPGTVDGADLGRGTGSIGGTCPDVIYPAKLHTPVLEVPVAPAQG